MVSFWLQYGYKNYDNLEENMYDSVALTTYYQLMV